MDKHKSSRIHPPVRRSPNQAGKITAESEEVSLPQILDARERRWRRQQALLRQYPECALVCFTMNIAGPIKNSPLIRRGFVYGCALLKQQLMRFRKKPVREIIYDEPTGNEGYFLLPLPPLVVKRLTADLEDNDRIGRLFDMDVLDASGTKLDRQALGLAPRACLICGQQAFACARSRAHPVGKLQEKTASLLRDFFRERDLRTIARDACRALLYEVCTTPKPGLVDRNNNGSHKDMDIFTFMDSTAALCPYFHRCGEIGMDYRDQTPAETFEQLRRAGIEAERSMFGVTKGVNTHKGAIFTMGLACAAIGRLEHEKWSDPAAVLTSCGELAAGIVERDLQKAKEKTALESSANAADLLSFGEKLCLQYGIRGVRGQAEDGFPAVLNAGLPMLERELAAGADINRAGSVALLAILRACTDTNLIARGGREAQLDVTAIVDALLKEQRAPSAEVIAGLDRLFIEENLSPGGSADLLGLCFLLHFLKTEEA